MNNLKLMTLALMALACATGRAQVLDLQTGRTADLTKEESISAEAGFVLGDVDYLGARVNLLLAERLLAGADLGVADGDVDSEAAIGIFGLYQLALDLPVSVAVKGSYHTTLGKDVMLSDLGADVVVSAPIAPVPNLSWYGNAGLHRGAEDFKHNSKLDDDDEFFLLIGGGAVYKISEEASAYAGLDIISGDYFDDVVIGSGIRWSFR